MAHTGEANLCILVCPPWSSPVLLAPCCWPHASKVSALCTNDGSDWLSTPWGSGAAHGMGTETGFGADNLMFLAGLCVV